jgi:hypothetical protein
MRRIISYIFFISAIVYLSACSQKVACPAYHSYFILDIDETKKVFTLFGADSLPKKNWEIETEKYGIAKNIPYKEKENEMRIISMNSIYKKIEDPMEIFKKAYPKPDSIYGEDIPQELVQTSMYEDFQNIDQMIYLHHFGKYMPKKDENRNKLEDDLKEEPLIADDEQEGEVPKKKKRSGLFGKKNRKSKADQTEDEELNEEK